MFRKNRIVVVCFWVWTLAGLGLYGGGKYSDAKPVIEEMAVSFEKFIVGLEKAADADSVAAALDSYSNVVVKLAPKVKTVMKKYPELKDETTHPEELKPLLRKMDDLTKRMAGLFGKIGQYSEDPKVKAALERWEKTMGLLDDEETE